MLKKVKAGLADKAADAVGDAKETSQAVLDSSRHIWLAGLGAFSRAQAEGMKMFEALVHQGETLESKTRRVVNTAVAARGAAKAKVAEVSKGVGGTWDKLEQVFENRVARALSKLGVYTQNDVQRLAQRVDALSDAVNALIKTSAGSPARPAGRTKKAATKPRSRKTPSTGKAKSAKTTKTTKTAKSVRVAKTSKGTTAKKRRAAKLATG